MDSFSELRPIRRWEHYLLRWLGRLRNRSRKGVLIVSWEYDKVFWKPEPTTTLLELGEEDLTKGQE